MAFTGVTNAHGPSPKPTACRSTSCSLMKPQQEVTRPKARLKPSLPKKSKVDGGVTTYIVTSPTLPVVIQSSYYRLQPWHQWGMSYDIYISKQYCRFYVNFDFLTRILPIFVYSDGLDLNRGSHNLPKLIWIFSLT